MKLYSYRYRGKETFGVAARDGKLCPAAHCGDAAAYDSLLSLIISGDRAAIAALREAAQRPHGSLPMEDTEALAPIPRPSQDILCLGFNYTAHAAESERYEKEAFGKAHSEAVYFSKRVNEALPDGGEIDSHPALTSRLDYEVELAVVIGKDAKGVSPEHAWDYVFGYTVLNDVSARDVQTSHQQWYFGKSLDTFAPMGPCIVTADEIPAPPALRIRSWVNGELRQDSRTDRLLYDIPYVIADLSAGMTLRAGTIIATGTPSGVGMGFDPPRFLKPGDTVECRVDGIGSLINTVR